jgi:hypothetical protein
MKFKFQLSICLLTALPNSALAQDIGSWTLGQRTDTDGVVVHIASLDASNLITSGSGGPDYAARYAITCRTGDTKSWTQQLELEDAIAGSGEIEIDARIDAKSPREETWIIGLKNRILTRRNTPDIAELKSAEALTLKWNWGWSWLWLSDKARLQLGEVAAVIFTLAKNCEIPEP